MDHNEQTPLLASEANASHALLQPEDHGNKRFISSSASASSCSSSWRQHKHTLAVGVVVVLLSVFAVLHQTAPSMAASTLQTARTTKAKPSFVLQNDRFMVNGQSVFLRSGAMHYFRVPPSQWKDRMLRLKAMGLNTLETYIAWNVHNPREDEYVFDGANDVEAYLELAQELGLYVILRPGPYICGEWDFGGFPAWLLHPKKNIQGAHHLRTYYPEYIAEVDKWFGVLLPRLERFMVQNGGNVVMVQVENEFGSYGDVSTNANDKKYLEHLIDLLHKYLGKDVVLFTVDWDGYFSRGSFKGDVVYTVGDFGPEYDAAEAFKAMKKFNAPGKSPNYNGEFYPGWLVHWGEHHANTSALAIQDSMNQMLSMNASFNFYMVHGGTNFGFMSGANIDGETYQPDITSYDYNAPLGEDGRHGFGSDGMDKFAIIKGTFQRFFGDSLKIPDEPVFQEAAVYTPFGLTEAVAFRDSIDTLTTSTLKRQENIQRMEAYGQDYGFIHYSRRVDASACNQQRRCKLRIDLVRDRAIVFVNGEVKGIVYRNSLQELSFQIRDVDAFQLELLVENMGRINFSQDMYDPKGIVGKGVYIDDQLITGDWTVNSLPLESRQIRRLRFAPVILASIKEPTFFHGQFSIEAPQTVRNTFLKMDGWEKGVVWVNGHNVGRYWQSQRTQQALFVPLDFLRRGVNDVVVLELDKSPSDVSTFQLSFSDHPIFWQ